MKVVAVYFEKLKKYRVISSFGSFANYPLKTGFCRPSRLEALREEGHEVEIRKSDEEPEGFHKNSRFGPGIPFGRKIHGECLCLIHRNKGQRIKQATGENEW